MYKRVKDDFQLRIVLIYGLCAAILISAFATYRFLSGSIAGGLLDLSLVLAPPAAFEYVLVHELCHLIHHAHSPAYWCEVEARFPAWREQRDYFRIDGRRLKASLRTLLSG